MSQRENDEAAAGGAGAGEDPRHRGAERSSPYPISRLAPRFDLVDTAREIQEADRLIGSVASGKLEQIARQIRALQEEAQEVLHRARRDLDLHRASCNFERKPGQVYHLYLRGPEDPYWSMLSPADWGGSPPHEHLGSYRLEADRSFTPLEEASTPRRAPEELVERLLAAKSSPDID